MGKPQNCMYVVVYYTISVVLNLLRIDIYSGKGGRKHHETFIGYGLCCGWRHAADILGGDGF